MRQAITAGDDTPQTPPNPGTPQTPRDSRAAQPGIVVRAGSPAALLAVIPHLLGFVPEASIVVIGLTPPRDRVRVTLRYDLPDPPDADLAADIAGHAAGVISSRQLTAAIAVGYGPEPLVRPAADAVRDAARRAGIDLHDFLRVQDGRYWSCRSGEEACCPAAGVPLGGIALEPMRQATRRAGQHVARLPAEVRRSARTGAARHMIAAEGLAAAGQMIARYRGGGRFTSDYEIARITVALRDLRVRDDAWARMDPAHRDAHRRLRTDVTRRAQPGYVAAPAALLALASSR